MCESTIPLVTDAALIDPFIKFSDNVIATDLNKFKYRQVMPGITLYSLIDLFPNYMGLKHHFLAKSSTNGETRLSAMVTSLMTECFYSHSFLKKMMFL